MVMAVRADLFRSAYEIMHEPKEIKRIKGGGRGWADREKGTIGGRWLGHDLTDVKTKWAGREKERERLVSLQPGKGCSISDRVLHLNDWWTRSMRITAGSHTHIFPRSSARTTESNPGPGNATWCRCLGTRALLIMHRVSDRTPADRNFNIL